MPLYGAYRRRQRMVAVKPKATARKYTPRRKNYNKKPQVSFASKVNAIVSRNIENKQTPSVNNTQKVCTLVGGTPSWFLINNWDTYLFTIPQGVQEQQRVGNQMKLKRWVVKGQIHPDPNNFNGITNIGNSQCGYIDVYFGRLTSNDEVTSDLPKFLDNGSSSVSPTGQQNQIFKPINKDLYKIYYHKRFKMSPSAYQTQAPQTGPLLPNNDFSLVRTFGFDVTKYICKNAIIKFDDASQQPQNAMIRTLAMWATWTPAIGDMVLSISGAVNHYYQISTCSYAEYEDA